MNGVGSQRRMWRVLNVFWATVLLGLEAREWRQVWKVFIPSQSALVGMSLGAEHVRGFWSGKKRNNGTKCPTTPPLPPPAPIQYKPRHPPHPAPRSNPPNPSHTVAASPYPLTPPHTTHTAPKPSTPPPTPQDPPHIPDKPHPHTPVSAHPH